MPASPEGALPAQLGLEAAGLDVLGVLAPTGYDARVPPAWRSAVLLPGARSLLLVGAGGRALFGAFESAVPAVDCDDPLDRYTRRALGEAVRRLEAAGRRARAFLACDRRGGAYADFVALGDACGLGARSRLGLLLHPRYGPWLSLRALLVTDAELAPTPRLAGFAPCRGCPAPCATACRGAAVSTAGFDVSACAAARRSEAACALRCDARRACVLGREHAYAARAEAHHMAHGGA